MTTLKNILLINAVSSGATGLGLIAVPGPISSLFEAPQTSPFIGVGVFLVAFAGMVFSVSRRNPQSESAVRVIIALDCLWVAVSFGVVIFQLFHLSTIGYLLIIAVALWVGLMAFLQYNGLRQPAASK